MAQGAQLSNNGVTLGGEAYDCFIEVKGAIDVNEQLRVVAEAATARVHAQGLEHSPLTHLSTFSFTYESCNFEQCLILIPGAQKTHIRKHMLLTQLM